MTWIFPVAVSALSIVWACLAVARSSIMDLSSGLGLMIGLFVLGALNVGVWGTYLAMKAITWIWGI